MENRISVSGRVSKVSIRKEGVSDKGNAWTLFDVRLENCSDAGMREGEEGPLAFSTFEEGIREGQFIEQSCRITGYEKTYEDWRTGAVRDFVALSMSAAGDVEILEEADPEGVPAAFGKAKPWEGRKAGERPDGPRSEAVFEEVEGLL